MNWRIRPKSIIEIMHNQILFEQPQSKETFINDIQKVSREDIVSVAEERLDTIYVLTKKEGVNNERALL